MINEALIQTEVNYTLERDWKVMIVEHVPARVCQETGERLYSPETVERIHDILKGERKPTRTVETPVYEFAGSLNS
jgi:YgiT-type zinc finger domain-containing protein